MPLRNSSVGITHSPPTSLDLAYLDNCSDDQNNLLFFAIDFQPTMCNKIVLDMTYIPVLRTADCKVTAWLPSLRFDVVRSHCEYHNQTWFTSLTQQHPRGSRSPSVVWWRWIQIHLSRPCFKYCEYLPDAYSVLYQQREMFQWKPTWGLLSTIPTISE
jgi:hypothetical protein